MANKALSIIIPAYNSAKYIEECLSSLKGLLAEELEILVVNDGSIDSTEEKVNACIINDERIKIFTVVNGGVSKARNIGLAHASGKYIMFLDADDYLISDVFVTIDEIVHNETYDFSAFSRDILETSGKIRHDTFPFGEIETQDRNITDFIMYASSLFNECWGKLYRKSIIDECEIRFPEGIPIGEDLMFVMEYYSKCNSFFVTNKSLVAYRQHVGSAMKSFSVNDRLKYTKEIYSFSKKYIPQKYEKDSSFYNFKVLTNICREYSRNGIDITAIETIYYSDIAREILKKLTVRDIPFYRLHEYILFKLKLVYISAIYYTIKAKR